ncbi:hypothetical protein RRG08_052830 [Elysia crispata]|uniref:Uncharacterized protein n=1 Tax=Elysia crispata TaxID=231223 RepID=A0AAE1B6R2_9GAST|nr:hypothetical protein RRG08_052830 [Elysia crispata]
MAGTDVWCPVGTLKYSSGAGYVCSRYVPHTFLRNAGVRTDSNGENCRRESEKLPKRPRRTTETRKALSQMKSKTLSPACQDIEKCSDQEVLDSEYFLRLKTFPDSESSWTKSWQDMCRNKDSKMKCTINRTCNNFAVKKNALFGRTSVRRLCGPNVFRRLFTQGSSTCLGNNTAMLLVSKNMIVCLKKNSLNHSNVIDTDRCKKINNGRNRDANFAASLCTDLQRWFIDSVWESYIEIFYPNCRGSLDPPAYKLPEFQ